MPQILLRKKNSFFFAYYMRDKDSKTFHRGVCLQRITCMICLYNSFSLLLYFYLFCAHAKTKCHNVINGVIRDFLPSRHSYFFTVVLCFSREFSLIRPSYFFNFLFFSVTYHRLQCHVSTLGDLKQHDHYFIERLDQTSVKGCLRILLGIRSNVVQ